MKRGTPDPLPGSGGVWGGRGVSEGGGRVVTTYVRNDYPCSTLDKGDIGGPPTIAF